MRSGGLAKRYARALLGLAREEGDPVGLGEALEQVAAALAAPSMAAVVRSPAVGTAARRGIIRSLVQELGIPRLLANCLFLLAERQRLDIADDIGRAYVELLDQVLGRTRVIVRSATPLSDDRLQELLTVLRKLTGKEHLIPVVEVDGELLGGVVCETEGVVYDGSVRTQVSWLARQMIAGPADR